MVIWRLRKGSRRKAYGPKSQPLRAKDKKHPDREKDRRLCLHVEGPKEQRLDRELPEPNHITW